MKALGIAVLIAMVFCVIIGALLYVVNKQGRI